MTESVVTAGSALSNTLHTALAYHIIITCNILRLAADTEIDKKKKKDMEIDPVHEIMPFWMCKPPQCYFMHYSRVPRTVNVTAKTFSISWLLTGKNLNH